MLMMACNLIYLGTTLQKLISADGFELLRQKKGVFNGLGKLGYVCHFAEGFRIREVSSKLCGWQTDRNVLRESLE